MLQAVTIKFAPGLDYVGFVVDKVALGQVFLSVFGFPLPLSFHRDLILIYIYIFIYLFIYHLGDKKIRPLVAAVKRQSLTA
jgi:hypothetical protein